MQLYWIQHFKSVEIHWFIVRIHSSCNLYTDFDKLQFWNGFFWIGCYCHWCRLSVLFLVRCLGVFIVIVWQNISGSSDIDKDEIIKFSVTYSLYFIAQIRTRMLRWWHCSKNRKNMLAMGKLEISLCYTAQLNPRFISWCFWLIFFPIVPCFFSRAIFIAFMRCKSCVAASKTSSDIDVGKIFDWHERRMHPDYSHYFSRFIGKSHCRVIIITIVTFERAFKLNAALFYISNSNMSAHFFSFFSSVWPMLHMLERCRKRLSE